MCAVSERNKVDISRPHRLNELWYANDCYGPHHIVSQHVQAHLGCDVLQRLHLEVGCSHPGFGRPARVFDGSAAQRDLARIIVEALLYPLQDTFVFPASDTSFLASRTSVLDHAVLALIRPIIV